MCTWEELFTKFARIHIYLFTHKQRILFFIDPTGYDKAKQQILWGLSNHTCIKYNNIEYNYHDAWNMNPIATISSITCVSCPVQLHPVLWRLAVCFMGLSIHVHVKARHLSGSAFCNLYRLGVLEKELGGIPTGFGILLFQKINLNYHVSTMCTHLVHIAKSRYIHVNWLTWMLGTLLMAVATVWTAESRVASRSLREG